MKVHLFFSSVYEFSIDYDFYSEDTNEWSFNIDMDVPCLPRKGDEIVLRRNDVDKLVCSLKKSYTNSNNRYTIKTLSNKLALYEIDKDNVEEACEDIATGILGEYITVDRVVFISGYNIPIVVCKIS